VASSQILYSPAGSDDDRVVTPAKRAGSTVSQQLEVIHWHILRGDNLRAAVATRAGAVLSTNALVVAGTALAFGLRNHRPDAIGLTLALVALGAATVSIMSASLALTTLRTWEQHFRGDEAPIAFPYSYAELEGNRGAFEDFKLRTLSIPPDQQLDNALAELWRCGRLHSYRYHKLRVAMRWLLVALLFLMLTIAWSAAQ
jgi:hypothetical protein